MLSESAWNSLREGDVIACKFNGVWRTVTVEIVHRYETTGRMSYIDVRRHGRDTIGRRFNKMAIFDKKWLDFTYRVKTIDPIDNGNLITANVFADWLEEQGFLEAAEALREKFPIVENGK